MQPTEQYPHRNLQHPDRRVNPTQTPADSALVLSRPRLYLQRSRALMRRAETVGAHSDA